jgi:excisionase family DNA binding protein
LRPVCEFFPEFDDDEEDDDEAAQLLSISRRSVEYLVASRRLSIRRIGTRALIPIEDIRRFARADHPENVAS